MISTSLVGDNLSQQSRGGIGLYHHVQFPSPSVNSALPITLLVVILLLPALRSYHFLGVYALNDNGKDERDTISHHQSVQKSTFLLDWKHAAFENLVIE